MGARVAFIRLEGRTMPLSERYAYKRGVSHFRLELCRSTSRTSLARIGLAHHSPKHPARQRSFPAPHPTDPLNGREPDFSSNESHASGTSKPAYLWSQVCAPKAAAEPRRHRLFPNIDQSNPQAPRRHRSSLSAQQHRSRAGKLPRHRVRTGGPRQTGKTRRIWPLHSFGRGFVA